MASFEISALDVVRISLSAHACLLFRELIGKLADCLLPLLSPFSVKIRTLNRLHKWAPYLLPRIFSEQTSLLVLVILALVALSHTSVSLTPFGHQPQPTPDLLIRVVLSLSAARYMVMASWLLLGREVILVRRGAGPKVAPLPASGESGSHVWDFLYYIVVGGTTLLSLGYHQNFLLAMTLPFPELSSSFARFCQIVEITSALKASRSRIRGTSSRSVSRVPRVLVLVACVICLICRVVLPALFLALAVQSESPLTMDWVPVAWFALSCAFLSSFHIVLIIQAIAKVTGQEECGGLLSGGKVMHWGLPFTEELDNCIEDNTCLVTSSANVEGSRRRTAPEKVGRGGTQRSRDQFLSIHNYPDSFTNDIYQDIALERQDLKKCQVGRLRDLNYGLLRPCDNRNVSSCTYISTDDFSSKEKRDEVEGQENKCTNKVIDADKINIGKKKDISKTWLLYRLLANSLSSSPPFPTSTVPSFKPYETSSEGVDTSPEVNFWMFPALLDASSNTKLQGQTSAPLDTHDNADNSVSFQCHSAEPHLLESSVKTGEPHQKCHISRGEAEAAKETTVAKSPPVASAAKSDTLVAIHLPEKSDRSKDTAFLDMKRSTNKSTAQTRQRCEGRYKLSPDCVQLLGGSKESLQESYCDVGKGSIAA